MKKKLISLSMISILLILGFGVIPLKTQKPNHIRQTASNNTNDRIAESEANTEYDSVENFLANNDVSVFMLDSKPADPAALAATSNPVTFNAADQKVSVSESYIAITYECEINGETFLVKLATYRSDNGEEQLDSVIDSNPGIFTQNDIGGISAYDCPGTEYDWFNCYATVIDGKLLVVNIEKGYDKYIEDVLKHIVLCSSHIALDSSLPLKGC